MFKGLPPGFYIDVNRYATGRHNKINDKVPSDFGLGVIFGAFLEGGVVHLSNNRDGSVVGSVRWYVPAANKEFCYSLVDTINEVFGLRASVYHRPEKEPNVYTVICNSKPLALFFKEFGYGREKHLPARFTVDNDDYAKGILHGLHEVKRRKVSKSVIDKPKVDELYDKLLSYMGIDGLYN